MAQIIMMAKEYRKRPSEILFIDDEYLAYCFDEVAYYLTTEAIDKKGQLNWNKFRWKNTERKTNADFMRFLQEHAKI